MKVTLDTDQNQMPADLTPGTPRQDGEWIWVTGEVELYFRTAQRLLVVDFGTKGQHVFRLDLPATPSNAEDWSAWQPVDHVFTDPAQTTGTPPSPARSRNCASA